MAAKKTKYIGARFTEKEKEDIEELVKVLDLNLSEFIRDAIFSHYHSLSKSKTKKIEILLIEKV